MNSGSAFFGKAVAAELLATVVKGTSTNAFACAAYSRQTG